jgi:ribose-phosphate pyrophosphokinase
MNHRAPLCLLACADANDLASSVARHLSVSVTPSSDTWFANQEGKHVIEANVRGADVYLFQRCAGPSPRSVYDRWVMLLHAVDAARHADADRVTVVVPYLPGSRQDKRKYRTREGVSTALFARMLEGAGVSMVLTVEPHNPSVVGCFSPSCVFEAIPLVISLGNHLAERGMVCDVVASTDVGGLENARRYAQLHQRDLVALSKERDYSKANTVSRTTVIGDVRDRSVLIIEDIVDTGGSAARAVDTLWENGATDVVLACAHPICSGEAWATLAALHARGVARGRSFRLVGTNSVLHPGAPSWYSSFSLDKLLSRVIREVNARGSVQHAVSLE